MSEPIHVSRSEMRVLKPGLHAWIRVKPNLGLVSCFCDWHEFEGIVEFAGEPANSQAVVHIGFSQLLIGHSCRAEYRGRLRSHGSISDRQDIPPSFRPGVSRDTYFPNNRFIFATAWGVGSPTVITTGVNGYTSRFTCHMMMYADMLPGNKEHVSTIDSPGYWFPQQRMNTLTKQPCFLHSFLVEEHFVTILIVQDADKRLHQLKHLFWNVHWDARFEVVDGAGGTTLRANVNQANTRVIVGPVLDGAPDDARFRHLVAAPYVPIALDVVNYAANHPVLTYKPEW